jgi:putative intracellular protease/amidase/YHS domain-containing protein
MFPMKRRDLLKNSTVLGLIGAVPFSRAIAAQANAATPTAPPMARKKSAAVANKLKPPADGVIPVAFLISDGAVVIDFCGPWEVFGNAMADGRTGVFSLYTVSETAQPITTSGGMKILPNYTIANAPAPKVIVIPAQNNATEAMIEWIRKSSKSADVTMSVCTGAYVLAATGLLAGKSATTHHSSYVDLAMKYPDVHIKRGARFVEDGNLASAGGLSSGIDLALRVVERYYGRDAATQTAYDMEYQGQGWMDADSNSVYAKIHTSANGHPLCAVCSMAVDAATAPTSAYKGTTYYFCSTDHKGKFDATPDQFVALIEKA